MYWRRLHNINKLGNWALRSSPNSNSSVQFADITYGSSGFVSIGYNLVAPLTNYCMTSVDGITGWMNRTISTYSEISNLTRIDFGNNMYVAVGSNGITSSPNGVTWTVRKTGVSLAWVKFGNGIFVVGSNNTSAPYIYTSTDGVSWVERAGFGTGRRVMDMGFGNGHFFALTVYDGSSGVNSYRGVIKSNDGINFTDTPTTGYPQFTNFSRYQYAFNKYYAMTNYANNMNFNSMLINSTDLLNWSPVIVPYDMDVNNITKSQYFRDILYQNGLMIMISFGSTDADKNKSSIVTRDGNNWEILTTPELHTWEKLAYGSGRFAACGVTPNPGDKIMTLDY